MAYEILFLLIIQITLTERSRAEEKQTGNVGEGECKAAEKEALIQ
jgi:hypothetical protein